MELLQHLQGDATTIVEKERKLSEMILQLQLFREQLLTQQDHSNKVIFRHLQYPCTMFCAENDCFYMHLFQQTEYNVGPEIVAVFSF